MWPAAGRGKGDAVSPKPTGHFIKGCDASYDQCSCSYRSRETLVSSQAVPTLELTLSPSWAKSRCSKSGPRCQCSPLVCIFLPAASSSAGLPSALEVTIKKLRRAENTHQLMPRRSGAAHILRVTLFQVQECGAGGTVTRPLPRLTPGHVEFSTLRPWPPFSKL